MRKKMLAVLLAVSMVASMTACGSSKSESTDGAKEASESSLHGKGLREQAKSLA